MQNRSQYLKHMNHLNTKKYFIFHLKKIVKFLYSYILMTGLKYTNIFPIICINPVKCRIILLIFGKNNWYKFQSL